MQRPDAALARRVLPDVWQEGGVTGRPADVPIYRVEAARKRLEAALLEGRVHAHLTCLHGKNKKRWVLVIRGNNRLCGTKRCMSFDHMVHVATVGEKIGARS